MKSTRAILLCIGIVGLSTAFFGLVNGDAIKSHLMTVICAASLIYGYFQLKNEDSKAY